MDEEDLQMSVMHGAVSSPKILKYRLHSGFNGLVPGCETRQKLSSSSGYDNTAVNFLQSGHPWVLEDPPEWPYSGLWCH